ncbi:preprotein translocase subunit SecG [Methyloferula stellata]|uniref:preprotein translocase subunit SecG n=1 Tax=Methyloferula stellata TaxID=876270 RepID=UPI00037710C9|nr:preprotein translocase subunit SecG [Methyloferula stellata]
MQTVLIVIHLMVVIALVAVVLLQRSEGGALGVGGGSGFMTGRGQANVLTRATAILAALFFATSLSLTLLANWNRAPKSILEGVTPPVSTTAPASTGGGSVLDDLKKIEEERQKQAPQAPEAPAAPEVPRSQ